MANRKKKVKVHRLYKNTISIMMILIGAAIITLVILNMNGIGPSIDAFGIINDLSDKVSNGTNLENMLDENFDTEVLTFSTNYDGMIYFRNSSLGDWNSAGDKFGAPDLYRTSSTSPLAFYPDKVINSQQRYQINIEMKVTLQRELVVDYSPYSINSNNDCYLNAKKKYNKYSLEFSPSLDYEEAKTKGFSSTDLGTLENSYRNHVNREYLTISNELKTRLERFAANNGLDKNSPTIIEDVSNFLKKNYTYNLVVPSSEGEDNIMYFLETSKKGICNNFAAASTMLYRTFGIPARFVNGFLSKGVGDGSEQKLSMISAHSWTEVYIYGSGWYRVDTTSERWDLDYPSNYDPDTPYDPTIPPDPGNLPNQNLPKFNFKSRSSIFYDGQTHSIEEIKDKVITVENLPEGYTYDARFSNSVTNVTDAGVYTYLVSIQLFDPDGNNITSRLNGQDTIIQGPLVFEVKPRPILISSDSDIYYLANNYYVFNQTQINDEFDVRFANESDLEVDTSFGVASKDTLETRKQYLWFTEPGVYTNSFNISIEDAISGNDMLKNYSVSFSYGEIRVQ